MSLFISIAQLRPRQDVSVFGACLLSALILSLFLKFRLCNIDGKDVKMKDAGAQREDT